MRTGKWLTAGMASLALAGGVANAEDYTQSEDYGGLNICGLWYQCDIQTPVVPEATGTLKALSFEAYGNWTVKIGTYTGDPLTVSWLTPEFVMAGFTLTDLSSYNVSVTEGVTLVVNLTATGAYGQSVRGYTHADGPEMFWRVATGTLPTNEPFMTLENGGVPHVMVISVVPEPQAYALLLAGLGVIGALHRRRA